ncbi:hypothetical protein N7540_013056 [Penicillium herquei]|nr:hypothetical protein N7540_013056 [Penicillium herquei]
MPSQQYLPLLDLSKTRGSVNSSALQRGFRKWGAFRLRAPQMTSAFARGVPDARNFFLGGLETSPRIKGHSPFGTEHVRGKTITSKQSVYFFRQCDQNTSAAVEPPPEILGAISDIREAWIQLRSSFFQVLTNEVLKTATPLIGTAQLDYETMGLHYYAPHQLASGECDYSPPHRDGGTLTILVREGREFDGLEVADLETTNEVDSARIGLDASFIPVPVASDEVVVFLGTRMQRLLGKDTARACVHRVRAQNEYHLAQERISLAIFCAPPA